MNRFLIILCTALLNSISSYAQSSNDKLDSPTPPIKSNFETHQEYSDAKSQWVQENENFKISNGAIEMNVIILENEDAEKEFIHPNSKSSEIQARPKAISEPQIVMPELD